MNKHGFVPEEIYNKNQGLIRIVAFVAATAAAAKFVRGVGRYLNPQYESFLRALTEHQKHPSNQSRSHLIKMYDFDFVSVPVEYATSAPLKKPILSTMANRSMGRLSIVWKVVGYVLLKTIGRRMLYPGSLQIMKTMLMPALNDGRAKFIESVRILLQF